MPDENPRISRPLIIALGLLTAAHLPFVARQCMVLWQQEHYQFFPFAFLVFGGLLRTRMVAGLFRWDVWSSVLFGLDGLLLISGSLLNSPLMVYVGACLLCFACVRGCYDKEFNTSLGYLILLPAITIRPPLAYDTRLIAGLQALTTKVGSRLLDFAGYLHIRDGNVLEFPGKRFLVEEACSGVQSLFAVMFLGCLIICGYRRRWLHGTFVLASAAGFAGLMNVLRICAISVAWADHRLDLSVGWEHDALGYISLCAAGLLVLSADAFWEMVFDRVPDTRGTGVSQLFRNPLIMFWNSAFHFRRRTTLPTFDAKLALQNWHQIVMFSAGVVCVAAIILQLQIF